ncbi:MAG TPA: glycine cleavage system aminomethyltransferase GcvT [Burkholderiales bacterium]|nr:glycine cleavage system aminomethyltransferase GcvT [Burkholderiales bacterium]
MPEALRRTPLYALHAELGARFTPFAGYEMPVQYAEGLRAEHLHTRAAAGLFDVSHMGQVRVTGPGLFEALERALPVDFADWPVGKQRYTLLLNERGGIEDDLMATRLPDEVRLVVNASTKEKDVTLLRRLCPHLSFEPLERALIALQGPRAERTLAALAPEVADLAFMSAAPLPIAGAECLVSRSGYTGEDGYEISVPAEDADRLARALLAARELKPVGLGARDTLRLEAGLHLYGQDMDADTTVLEASLGWAIARSRRAGGKKQGGFPGAHVYQRELREGAKRRLVGLIGEEAVPIRHGAELLADGKNAGVVTSGTVSPSTSKAIMLASLRAEYGADMKLSAVVRGTQRPVRIAKLPFVPKRYK